MMSLPGDGEVDFGGVDDGLDADGGEVVAVEVDVEDADGDFAIFERFDFRGEALGEGHAAAADADEGELIEIFGLFEDFVRQADQGAVDLGRAHELAFSRVRGMACKEQGNMSERDWPMRGL